MAATYPVTVLELPWALTNDDQRFKKILAVLLLLFLGLAIPIAYVTLPELTRAEKETLPPPIGAGGVGATSFTSSGGRTTKSGTGQAGRSKAGTEKTG